MAQILIVEDEDNIATALEFLMTRDGHDHRRLALGAGALDAIRAAPPDLVLLDIMLPDISGYEVIEALRADPALRDRYATQKTELAERHADDKAAYTEAKAPFIRTVIDTALAAKPATP